MNQKQWFAVRTIFCHAKSTAKKAIFEEKISMYLAADANAAKDAAEQDAQQYLELNKGFVQVQRYGVFMLGHNEKDLGGREVWSQLMEGPADADTFYQERYEKFTPDDLG